MLVLIVRCACPVLSAEMRLEQTLSVVAFAVELWLESQEVRAFFMSDSQRIAFRIDSVMTEQLGSQNTPLG